MGSTLRGTDLVLQSRRSRNVGPVGSDLRDVSCAKPQRNSTGKPFNSC
jgi:hypothetical protein